MNAYDVLFQLKELLDERINDAEEEADVARFDDVLYWQGEIAAYKDIRGDVNRLMNGAKDG